MSRFSGRVAVVTGGGGFTHVGNPAYSAAKAGLIQLTRSLAVQYGPHGVRANAICPGMIRVDSPAWQRRPRNNPDMESVLARWYPVGRLASDDARYVTGALPFVDGGFTAYGYV